MSSDKQLHKTIWKLSKHFPFPHQTYDFDGLVQNCSISIANAREILKSCTLYSHCLMLFIVSLNATRWVNIRIITYRLQCHSYSISQEICTRFFVLCFVVVMQSFIMNSHKVFIHIHQGCFAGTGAIVRLPQCQWSKPDVYGKISQCITTTKHSKAKTVCIFLGIYCTL